MYTETTFEGVRVADMQPAALLALQTRCATYLGACAQRGLTPEAVRQTLCNAVAYYMAQHNAWAVFSSVRAVAIGAGYAINPLEGNMSQSDVWQIVRLLRDIITNDTAPVENQAILDIAITEANARAHVVSPLESRIRDK